MIHLFCQFSRQRLESHDLIIDISIFFYQKPTTNN